MKLIVKGGLFVVMFVFLSQVITAQDVVDFKRIVESLSSADFQGRGYAFDGVRKAGKFLEQEFRKAGADDVFTQPFCIDVNTFPGDMEMTVDGRSLEAGTEFSMREYSPGVKGEYGLYYIDTLDFNPSRIFDDLAKPDNKNVFVVCDFWFTYKHREVFSKLQSATGCPDVAGLVYVWNTPLKFYKAYGENVVDKPIVWVSSSFPEGARKVGFNIENKFLKQYESNNVIAKVEGARHDSCFVFTAHYDHLGNLGRDLYFPGANDNASGTAAIVTLCEYYSQNKPEFDIWFIAFSGEDTNLRGSTYFAQHPYFPLESIRYLFNLDMVGDNNPVQYCEVSEEGMEGFHAMENIVNQKGYFQKLHLGELAANSDHFPFAQRHVPCILFENESGDFFQYYHTAQDTPENTVPDTYSSIFKLVTDYILLSL